MIDTGSEPNLIKVSSLKPDIVIDPNNKVSVTGITEQLVSTLGSTVLTIFDVPIEFQVVPDTFGIPSDGVLGSAFLEQGAEISYLDRLLTWQDKEIPFLNDGKIHLKPRTSTTISMDATGPATGYLHRRELAPGVLIPECMANITDGKTTVRCINTTDEPVSIPIPTVELEEVEEIAGDTDTQSSSIFSLAEINSATRVSEIKELIDVSHLNKTEKEHVEQIIHEFHDLFYLPGDRLGKTDKVTHKILTTDEMPVHVKQYRYPPIHRDEINRQMKELLEQNIVAPSKSPYNSPLWIVPKKADANGNKKWRMVIDFRALNEKSIPDAYPLPSILEILDQLGSAKYFSVFDLANGFHQIGMDPVDAAKTAFSTPYGHYEYKRMPFGLRNAPATFQRLMDNILTGLQGIELFVYLDDIVIYSRSLEEHYTKFSKLAHRLREAKLKLQPSKCGFLHREVAYLGHIIGEDGVKPCPKKIAAVKDFPRPKNAKGIREFLGLAGYYRRFIPKFSKISKPLANLLKKDQKFEWKGEHEESFCTLREILTTEPILQYPDFSKEFNITTDASGYAIGGILSQGEPGKDLPIAYASRLLHGAELNYSTIEKECLAIIYCTQYFRPYVYGHRFNLITDHKPLVWMNSVKDPTSRLLRWRLKLAEFDYRITYKAGKTNVNADALSRNPVPTLPVSAISDSDGSDLFDAIRRQPSLNDPGTPTSRSDPSPIPSSSRSPSPAPPLQPEALPIDDGDEADLPTTSDSETLFDSHNDSVSQARRTIIHVRDRLIMRPDHIAVFISVDGQPLDEGAMDLFKNNKLPQTTHLTPCRARVFTGSNGKRIILLPIKRTAAHNTSYEDMIDTFRSLLDVALELQLTTISISKIAFDDISWAQTHQIIVNLFSETQTQIFVCANEIIIPPVEERQDILIENHCSAFAGHKGITKTYRRIREKYFWPTLKKDVQDFVNSCRSCEKTKLTRIKTRQPMTITDTPGKAFEKISMDIVGPLPISPNKFEYILTMQDLLTKYSWASPLKTATAVDIAHAFSQDFICRFGAPKAILTDQGANFLSSLMKNVAKKFRIKQFKTTAFRPQSNGSIERSHHVLTEYLKQYISRGNWDEWLPMAMFAYNTSVHEGTSFTPHELVFGTLARTPSATVNFDDTGNESYQSYLESLQTKISDTTDQARENLNNAKLRSKKYYDRKTNVQEFVTGDYVFLLKEPKKGKFDDEYSGPYKVIECLNDNNVRLKTPKGTRVVHVNKLKHARNANTRCVRPIPIGNSNQADHPDVNNIPNRSPTILSTLALTSRQARQRQHFSLFKDSIESQTSEGTAKMCIHPKQYNPNQRDIHDKRSDFAETLDGWTCYQGQGYVTKEHGILCNECCEPYQVVEIEAIHGYENDANAKQNDSNIFRCDACETMLCHSQPARRCETCSFEIINEVCDHWDNLTDESEFSDFSDSSDEDESPWVQLPHTPPPSPRQLQTGNFGSTANPSPDQERDEPSGTSSSGDENNTGTSAPTSTREIGTQTSEIECGEERNYRRINRRLSYSSE